MRLPYLDFFLFTNTFWKFSHIFSQSSLDTASGRLWHLRVGLWLPIVSIVPLPLRPLLAEYMHYCSASKRLNWWDKPRIWKPCVRNSLASRWPPSNAAKQKSNNTYWAGYVTLILRNSSNCHPRATFAFFKPEPSPMRNLIRRRTMSRNLIVSFLFFLPLAYPVQRILSEFCHWYIVIWFFRQILALMLF